MKIEILAGDATEVAGYDGLVIPANRQLTLGWGSHVAEAVLAKAGKAVDEEALSLSAKGIEMGEALVTGAGSMKNFSRLVHAAVLDRYDFNPLFLLRLRMRTSPECLSKAVSSSLEAAAAAGLDSIVLTPMGSGIGGMPEAICAKVMHEAIESFFKPGGREKPGRIAIVCMKEKTAQIFRREFSILL